MIVDSSALIAVLRGEPGWEQVAQVAVDGSCRMSTATWLEASVVADQRAPGGGERLDDLVDALGIELVPLSVRDAQVARLAYRRFGRGSGSQAMLNLGDCFSYALAATSGEPLLYVGDYFSATDIASAM
ncbi:type II toxin-antitoxin system VapC family toxin [Georgenia sp. Z1491]|uniref:type II toxin-antitoxin system VapC family toxin n=1 Tax=Georgenia sp. Z1491 TaxID=3416707 RepID=UPI003CF89DF2